MPALTAWPASLRRPAPPATLTSPPALRLTFDLDHSMKAAPVYFEDEPGYLGAFFWISNLTRNLWQLRNTPQSAAPRRASSHSFFACMMCYVADEWMIRPRTYDPDLCG